MEEEKSVRVGDMALQSDVFEQRVCNIVCGTLMY
jgi:hypothetical protein